MTSGATKSVPPTARLPSSKTAPAAESFHPPLIASPIPDLIDLRLCVTPQHADHHALHLHLVGVDETGLHRAVGGLEADLGSLLVEPLERRLAAVQERDHLLPVAGVLAAFDDHEVAVHQ